MRALLLFHINGCILDVHQTKTADQQASAATKNASYHPRNAWKTKSSSKAEIATFIRIANMI
jgi:hypothetical protein